jgi:predicted transcriptional regulator
MTHLSPAQTRSLILEQLATGAKTAGELFDTCGRHYPQLYVELQQLTRAGTIDWEWQQVHGLPAIVYRRVQVPQPALFNPFRFPSSA